MNKNEIRKQSITRFVKGAASGVISGALLQPL